MRVARAALAALLGTGIASAAVAAEPAPITFGEVFPMRDVWAFSMTATLDSTVCIAAAERSYECRIGELTFASLPLYDPGANGVEPLLALPQKLPAGAEAPELRVVELTATELVVLLSRPAAAAPDWMDDGFSYTATFLVLARLTR